jgi:hypothetical protein
MQSRGQLGIFLKINPTVTPRSVPGCRYVKCFTFALVAVFFGVQLPSLLTAPDAAVSQKTPSVSIESLSDAEVDAALESIWLKSSRDGVRKPETARRAALDAYVRGGAAGAKLVARKNAANDSSGPAFPQQAGFHAEVMTSKIGYVRIAGFEASVEERLDRALSDFRQLNADRIVLDLRFGAINGDLEQAARLASRFVPKGTELFSVREVDAATDRKVCNQTDPGRMPSMLWVLISRFTAGPAEVLAACLKLHGHATLVGEPTKGELSEFLSIDLNEWVSLKVPVRDPVFSGISAVPATGILPDVPVNVSLQETLDILRVEANAGSVSALLREPHYFRTSEQTLVSGDNPELESRIEAALKPSLPNPIFRDAVLQCALDATVALDLLNGGNSVRR